MGCLISVNVGLPREVEWEGRIVRTAIWKAPVDGRRPVRRLNIEGDGQADLAGHGGEQRAVLVYQIDSYHHWQQALGRDDFVHGQFGENFTVSGLADNEVCIGDRYRIGTALFEVTQPRTTCYRVGIRVDHPHMAALLTSSGRPGFYFRVIEEGEVGAGDAIVLVAKGPQSLTVAEVNALLYSSRHPRDQLERVLQIPALSPGWRESFEALLRGQDDTPVAIQGVSPGFRSLRVARIARESAEVVSLELRSADGAHLKLPFPGQFVVLRLRPDPAGPPLIRSYSLSGPPSEACYRISVRVTAEGVAGPYLRASGREGDRIEVSEPRGVFTLRPGDGPVVLLSAGIGATPVLAMLHALAADASPRDVWWLHGARDGESHPFAEEARRLLDGLPRGHRRVWYSRPGSQDQIGTGYDFAGRISAETLEQIGVPRDGDFYLCGPSIFIGEISAAIAGWGVSADRIHSELFVGAPALTPGIVSATARAPHPPAGPAGTGPMVSFARSGLAVRWHDSARSLLDLAEACDVPVRWSCRSGVCHNCESGLISGEISYEPDPFDPPVEGNLLICCARPRSDVVIDL